MCVSACLLPNHYSEFILKVKKNLPTPCEIRPVNEVLRVASSDQVRFKGVTLAAWPCG